MGSAAARQFFDVDPPACRLPLWLIFCWPPSRSRCDCHPAAARTASAYVPTALAPAIDRDEYEVPQSYVVRTACGTLRPERATSARSSAKGGARLGARRRSHGGRASNAFSRRALAGPAQIEQQSAGGGPYAIAADDPALPSASG
jgi:hypothetical protein